MRGGPTYDKERTSISVARLKKGGETFELAIDPDNAVKYKQGDEVELSEVLKAEHIYADANKGELASEEHMTSLFDTQDVLMIAEIILQEGEIQLTREHRDRIREGKFNRLVDIIRTNAVNPQTKTVHPEDRIRKALEEARFRINEFKTAQDQVQDALTAIRPIIPITFTTFTADIHLPSKYAAQCYGTLGQYGSVTDEQWLSDGTLAAKVELPAGRYNDLVDELASKTHGTVEITKIENR